MINDLSAVFQKHNWSGRPVGLSKSPPDHKTLAAASRISLSDDPSSGSCPGGGEPQWVTYKLPDGTWATKMMCV